MNISHETKENISIIKLEGRLIAKDSNKLKNLFKEQSESYINFILDLKELQFIDSSGLGAIVWCLKTAEENNGTVKIVNLQPKPKLLFEITRAFKLFDIFDSLEEAQNSFNS